ncbi:DUF948 domain-containing protein [Thiovibrio sp. JS02]
MTFTEILTLLGALSLFAIAIVLIPTILQLRRSLNQVEIFIQSLNRHIDPLCKSLTEATRELQTLTLSLNDKVERTDSILRTVQKSADSLLTTSHTLKEIVRPIITNMGGISAGIRTFTHILGKVWKNP